MEKELIKIKEEIAKSKTRIFDLETKVNNLEKLTKINNLAKLLGNKMKQEPRPFR